MDERRGQSVGARSARLFDCAHISSSLRHNVGIDTRSHFRGHGTVTIWHPSRPRVGHPFRPRLSRHAQAALLVAALLMALGVFLGRVFNSPSPVPPPAQTSTAPYQVGFNDGVLNAGLQSAASTPIRPTSDCQTLARTLARQQDKRFVQGCVVGEQRFEAGLHR